MRDVGDPSQRPLDELEPSLQRIEREMKRRRVADASVDLAMQVMEAQASKAPALAAKQARLLEKLRQRLWA
jgi:hypothetical protein